MPLHRSPARPAVPGRVFFAAVADIQQTLRPARALAATTMRRCWKAQVCILSLGGVRPPRNLTYFCRLDAPMSQNNSPVPSPPAGASTGTDSNLPLHHRWFVATPSRLACGPASFDAQRRVSALPNDADRGYCSAARTA